MSYSSEVLADSPRIHWKLDEAAGPTATDSSGNGLDGTYTNSPTIGSTAGPLASGGTAVTFAAASSQWISRADDALLDLGDIFTVEAFVKLATAPGSTSRAILSKGVNAYYLRIGADGKVVLLKDQVAGIVSSISPLPNTGWHHVAATKTGATVKLYVDGIDDTGTVTNATCLDTAYQLAGARDAPDVGSEEYFDGSLAHLAVYPTALSAARILAHYNAALVVPLVSDTPMPIMGRGASW